jgi:hypothetical protein
VVDETNGIVQLTLRWTGPPTRKSLGGGINEVDCPLEVMP